MLFKRLIFKGLALLLVAYCSSQAFAHHVFSAEYDANQPIELTGVLTSVKWMNPHSWITVEVKDKGGNVANWSLEFGSPNQLSRRGFKKTDLKVGEQLVVFAYLHKNRPLIAIAHNVKFPEGKEIYVGGDGTGVPEPKANAGTGTAPGVKAAE